VCQLFPIRYLASSIRYRSFSFSAFQFFSFPKFASLAQSGRLKLDTELAPERARGAVQGGQSHGRVPGVEQAVQSGARGSHATGHGCLLQALLLHNVFELQGHDPFEGRRLHFLQNSFVPKEVIETASGQGIYFVNFARFRGHFFSARPRDIGPLICILILQVSSFSFPHLLFSHSRTGSRPLSVRKNRTVNLGSPLMWQTYHF
jgi:hypothetical protein